jgi:hypothetical protein
MTARPVRRSTSSWGGPWSLTWRMLSPGPSRATAVNGTTMVRGGGRGRTSKASSPATGSPAGGDRQPGPVGLNHVALVEAGDLNEQSLRSPIKSCGPVPLIARSDSERRALLGFRDSSDAEVSRMPPGATASTRESGSVV